MFVRVPFDILTALALERVGEGDGTALYRVRLVFADPQNSRPGQRVFDIKLQGKQVLEDFDIVEAAGGRNRAVVKQFDGVKVSDKLVIELLPKTDPAKLSQAPILHGVEILRDRVLTMGCSTSDFVLSSLEPRSLR